MTGSLLDRQSELPDAIPLLRYVPERIQFSWREWDPAAVRSADDLPQYLILGDLDRDSFSRSASGWSARWQGTEDNTHFDVSYEAHEVWWKIDQTWRGLDGGFSVKSTRVPLDKVIGQSLYMQFPPIWDSEAKSQLESEYQITVVEQPANAYAMCGIPDGAFRTLIFPIAVGNLRPVQQWIRDLVEAAPLMYPIAVDAKLVFQALNYLEGKAPEWTTKKAIAFNQSVIETGLAPHGLPVREVASDGTVAWTLRREIYFLFILLPFAGLTDFLARMSTDHGPIRTGTDPDLRFELQPVVLPAGFEIQTESVEFWDKARTTRSFLKFKQDTEDTSVPTAEQLSNNEQDAPERLARSEEISREVVSAIEQLFKDTDC